MLKLAVRLAALVLTVWCWRSVRTGTFSAAWSIAIMWGGVALVPLVAFAGRYVLDHRPQLEREGWVTTAVHYAEAILLGCAVMVALGFGKEHPIATIPLPRYISQPFLQAIGAFLIATILNLAIQGLGAPFAVALTKKIADGWLYSRTRNPMVLGTLVFAVVLGFWLQSLHVVLWAAAWLSPAWLIFVRVYEERELELRFGAPYLDYKRQTPFLWPRMRSTQRARSRDAGHAAIMGG
jgi:protein-S-isoprenylcysteine O-methyltransferase Ste14